MSSKATKRIQLPNTQLTTATLSLALTFIAFFGLILTSDAFRTPSWFDGRPNGFGFPYDYLEYPLTSLILVLVFAVPLAFWHGLDLAYQNGDTTNDSHFLESYGPVLTTFLGGMIGTAVILSGFTEWLSCYRPELVVTDELGNQWGFFCTPNSAYLIEFLVFPFFLILLLLVVLKAGFLIRRKIS